MEKLLRMSAVLEATGVSKSRLYELIGSGLFPAGVPLTEGARIVGWPASEVSAWIDARIQAARGQAAVVRGANA